MPKTKRGGGDLARSLHKNRRACNDGMILVNTFEETFGDIYGKGVWSKLSKKSCSNIDRSVVALASFDAILTSASLIRSSGDENKIVDNLRIEVLLPNKQCIEGILKHFNLHYNVALVSVDYRALRPANVQLDWRGKSTEAGIGGPLVSVDGDVIGVNFYDTRIGTPFLPWETIVVILASFEEKRVGDPSSAPFWKMSEDDKVELNRWPVPMPCWRHPECVEDESEDDEELKYNYINGEKCMFF
uniref:Peptidase S1 domain-containing protein n=1 Tax=Oryza punctata TaxID=4537 RepID=A0A0E0K7Q0_ORYPU